MIHRVISEVVDLPCTNRVLRCEGTDLGIWYVKDMDPFSMLTEAVGLLFARKLGANVPGFAWTTGGPVPGRIAVQAVTDYMLWHAEAADLIVNLDELASLLLADVLLGVDDRHVGNALLTPAGDGLVRLWGIDFDKARITSPKTLEGGWVPEPPDLPGLELHELAPTLRDAATRAGDLSDGEVWDVLDRPDLSFSPAQRDEVVTVLAERCACALQLTDRYLAQVPAP